MCKLNVTGLAIVLLTGCQGNPLGKPCKVDNDCGPGFDCYPDICVPVCTKADECLPGQTCYRYHCVVPGQEHVSRARPPTAPTPTPPPPPPGMMPPRAGSQGPVPAPPPSASPPMRVVATPPLPDTTAAELRAIRRELEILAAEQVKLTTAVEELRRNTAKPEKPASRATEPLKKP
jgi:hypothetical protein